MHGNAPSGRFSGQALSGSNDPAAGFSPLATLLAAQAAWTPRARARGLGAAGRQSPLIDVQDGAGGVCPGLMPCDTIR